MGKYSNEIEKLLKTLTLDKIQEQNNKHVNIVNKEYEEFLEYYKKGECYICKKSINIFSSQNPCLHYLLRRSNKFKKKNFKDIYSKWSYFQISSYLRWVANQERLIGNINNLEDEKGKNKKFEYTIKWKNIEWSFSCANSDFIGHEGTNSDFPHYHFQMRIDNQSFIFFSEYHIPFSDRDLFDFDFFENKKVYHGWGKGGDGIQDFFDKLDNLPDNDLNIFVNNMTYIDNEEIAQVNISTIIEGPINGDDLNKLLKEREKTGKTINTLIKENYPNHKIQTIIRPIDSIPKIANRI